MKLGYTFADPALLQRALTHPSAASDPLFSNQRLEFLGDTVIELVVTEWLYTRFADWTEGPLSKARSAAVRKETLAEVADELGLTEALQLNPGAEKTGVRRSVKVRSDACEAVFGAVYLDGGLEAARAVTLQALGPWLARIDQAQNPRSTLQEWLDACGKPPAEYSFLGAEGPAHALLFRYTVRADDREFGPAEGPSKAAAMAAAAALAVAELVRSPPQG